MSDLIGITIEEVEEKEREIAGHIKAISDLLCIETTESNVDTPERIAKMYSRELFKHRNNYDISVLDAQIKLFDNPNYKGKVLSPVVMKDISFSSTCEHHWLPFMGVAKVTYIPKKKIIGLSKIPRVVKFFSQKPQLQERLTQEICDYLYNVLNPIMVKVELTATHCCVMCRGAESDCITETTHERWSSDDKVTEIEVAEMKSTTQYV